MIHLITLAGAHVDVLPHMLEHYRSLGVESFFVNLNLSDERDPVREQVEEITRQFGCGIAGVTIGDWHLLQQQVYLKQREQYPSDWFILADQDELQVYPADLRDVIADCGSWDLIRGCFVDRIARDGGFPAMDPARPLWEQFTLGGFITALIAGGDPRKVVAVKGAVPIRKGNHHASKADLVLPASIIFRFTISNGQQTLRSGWRSGRRRCSGMGRWSGRRARVLSNIIAGRVGESVWRIQSY